MVSPLDTQIFEVKGRGAGQGVFVNIERKSGQEPASVQTLPMNGTSPSQGSRSHWWGQVLFGRCFFSRWAEWPLGASLLRLCSLEQHRRAYMSFPSACPLFKGGDSMNLFSVQKSWTLILSGSPWIPFWTIILLRLLNHSFRENYSYLCGTSSWSIISRFSPMSLHLPIRKNI